MVNGGVTRLLAAYQLPQSLARTARGMSLFLVDSVLAKIALVTEAINNIKARSKRDPIGCRTCTVKFMSSSFHNARKQTHRRVVLTGLIFCTAFAVISLSASERPNNNSVRATVDRLVRTAMSLRTLEINTGRPNDSR
jgi:hypothetical protein